MEQYFKQGSRKNPSHCQTFLKQDHYHQLTYHYIIYTDTRISTGQMNYMISCKLQSFQIFLMYVSKELLTNNFIHQVMHLALVEVAIN